jgi:hypothetical protein
MTTPKINSQDILDLVREKQLDAMLRDAKTQLDKEQLFEQIETETDRIIEDTCKALQQSKLNPDIEKEVSILLDQLLYLRKMGNIYLVRMADNAINLLLSSHAATPSTSRPTPDAPHSPSPTIPHRNLIIARRIRHRIRYEIFVNNSQSTMLILGLAGFIGLFAILPSAFYLLIQSTAPSLELATRPNGNLGIQASRALTLKLPSGERLLQAGDIYDLVIPDSTKNRAGSTSARSSGTGSESAIAPDTLPPSEPPSTAPMPIAPAPAPGTATVPPATQSTPEAPVAPPPAALESDGSSAASESATTAEPLPSESPSAENLTDPPANLTSPSTDIIVVPQSPDNFLQTPGDFFENVGINLSLLLIVVIGGALGSSISVIVRAQNFVKERRAEPLSLFFTGLLKPIVGIAFAIFIFAALESGLVSVGNREQTNRTYLYLAIAFIAGFSERFVQDILVKTEQTIIPPSRNEQQSDT